MSNHANRRRTLRGESAETFLQAKALLETIGIDPDAPTHRADLMAALDAGGRPSRWANREAHTINRKATPRKPVPAAATAEDVEFILDTDPAATIEQIAHRLGYRDKTGVANALRRAGRPDLIGRLARNARGAA